MYCAKWDVNLFHLISITFYPNTLSVFSVLFPLIVVAFYQYTLYYFINRIKIAFYQYMLHYYHFIHVITDAQYMLHYYYYFTTTYHLIITFTSSRILLVFIATYCVSIRFVIAIILLPFSS